MYSVTEDGSFLWQFKVLHVVVVQCIFEIIDIHFTLVQHSVSVELSASPSLLLHKIFNFMGKK